jgi:hypothetical protein
LGAGADEDHPIMGGQSKKVTGGYWSAVGDLLPQTMLLADRGYDADASRYPLTITLFLSTHRFRLLGTLRRDGPVGGSSLAFRQRKHQKE